MDIKQGRPALGRNNQTLTVTISKELHKKLQDISTKQERSMSFIAKKAIEAFLNKE